MCLYDLGVFVWHVMWLLVTPSHLHVAPSGMCFSIDGASLVLFFPLVKNWVQENKLFLKWGSLVSASSPALS